MMLVFMWLGIRVFGTEGADTLDFPPMTMSIFHIKRSHYFVDFAFKTKVYNRLVDLCTCADFFHNKDLILNYTYIDIRNVSLRLTVQDEKTTAIRRTTVQEAGGSRQSCVPS